MARPSPAPAPFLVVKNGSKMRPRFSAAIPGPLVADRELDSRTAPPARDRDPPATVHRLRGVQQDVEHHLLELAGARTHERVVGHGDVQENRVRAGPVLEERGCFVDHLRERDRARIGSSLTREKSVSVRVIPSTRAMLDEMLARPRSKISGEAPRFDCRICTIEWIAASGLLTSWQTPGDHEAERCETRRLRIRAGQVVEHRDDGVLAGAPHREPFADGSAVRRAHDVELARRREIAGEHGVIVGEARGEGSLRARTPRAAIAGFAATSSPRASTIATATGSASRIDAADWDCPSGRATGRRRFIGAALAARAPRDPALGRSGRLTGLPSRPALGDSPLGRPGGLTGLPSRSALGDSPLGRPGGLMPRPAAAAAARRSAGTSPPRRRSPRSRSSRPRSRSPSRRTRSRLAMRRGRPRSDARETRC